MRWNDLVELLLQENGGVASLQFLYNNAHRYKKLPSKGDWQKTLRGVLYRDVKKGRFKKVGLGVYAIPNFQTTNSAYEMAIRDKNPSDFIRKSEDIHSVIEGMLLELGNFYDFLTYTSDTQKTFDGKLLNNLRGIKKLPNFTYEKLKNITRKIDVVWFNKRSNYIFPKYFFEVENSTDFSNSLLKMYQLRAFEAGFFSYIIQIKENIFDERIKRDPFPEVKQKFQFKSFEDIGSLYFSAVKHFELKSSFLVSKYTQKLFCQTLIGYSSPH